MPIVLRYRRFLVDEVTPSLAFWILAVIGNIMNLKNVPGYHQEVVKGVIPLVAVLLQSGVFTRRQSETSIRTMQTAYL